jgi:hypothetical protein
MLYLNRYKVLKSKIRLQNLPSVFTVAIQELIQESDRNTRSNRAKMNFGSVTLTKIFGSVVDPLIIRAVEIQLKLVIKLAHQMWKNHSTDEARLR